MPHTWEKGDIALVFSMLNYHFHAGSWWGSHPDLKWLVLADIFPTHPLFETELPPSTQEALKVPVPPSPCQLLSLQFAEFV